MSQRDRLLSFDPNKPEYAPWATYSPTRTMTFKLHTKRATALNALHKLRDLATLYRHVDDKWVEVARMDREARDCRCDVCGGSTARQIPNASGWVVWSSRHVHDDVYDTGKFVWERDQRRRIIDPLVLLYVCEKCYPTYR